MMIIFIQSVYDEIKARSNKIPKVEKGQNLAYYSLLRDFHDNSFIIDNNDDNYDDNDNDNCHYYI